MRIEAPYPLLATTLLLPNPREANSVALGSTVEVQRMMDGSVRTYVKRRLGRRKHRWDFLVSVDKAQEVRDFVARYPGAKVRVVWRETIFGYLTLNPLEEAGQGGVDERYLVTLELETV